MIIDLRKDFADLYAHVVERVQGFDPATNDGPGKGRQVAWIQFGYQFDQAGWAALIFDTRPNAGPDGEWNSHIEGNLFERDDWLAAAEATGDQTVTLILPDGSELSLNQDSNEHDFARPLGEMLRDVLLKACADGVFAKLTKTPGCEIGVEEHDGYWGWPDAKSRGRDNLVEPQA